MGADAEQGKLNINNLLPGVRLEDGKELVNILSFGGGRLGRDRPEEDPPQCL